MKMPGEKGWFGSKCHFTPVTQLPLSVECSTISQLLGTLTSRNPTEITKRMKEPPPPRIMRCINNFCRNYGLCVHPTSLSALHTGAVHEREKPSMLFQTTAARLCDVRRKRDQSTHKAFGVGCCKKPKLPALIYSCYTV